MHHSLLEALSSPGLILTVPCFVATWQLVLSQHRGKAWSTERCGGYETHLRKKTSSTAAGRRGPGA